MERALRKRCALFDYIFMMTAKRLGYNDEGRPLIYFNKYHHEAVID